MNTRRGYLQSNHPGRLPTDPSTHYRNAACAQSHLDALFKLPIIAYGTFSGKF